MRFQFFSLKQVLLFSSLLALGFMQAYGQNYIYRGDKRYSATEKWEFRSRDYGDNLDVQVAADGSAGLLLLSASTVFENTMIGGTVTLFLENGNTIKCFDRNIKDRVNNQSLALYFLTTEEMNLLSGVRYYADSVQH